MENKLLDLGFDVAGNNYVFTSPKGYEIIICFTESKYIIDYGKDIKVRHKSTSNLTKPENWVVLECVIRLLNKGYSPSAIELEKTWLLGHDESGRVDILLKDIFGKTYALIECKTWGSEYN
jgi:type I restriction enzyme M protein